MDAVVLAKYEIRNGSVLKPRRVTAMVSVAGILVKKLQTLQQDLPHVEPVTHPEKTWARRCGFFGYESVKSSEQALQDLCSVTVTVFSMLLNLLPEQRYRSSDVTKEDRLLLFLMKLKLGVSLTALGAIFGISKYTASRVFRVTLDCLSVKLRKWVFAPPRCVIKDTLPECFVQHYPKCTFIIDCTEIRTETPMDPEAQHYLYSHYKVSYTLKFLIAILPNGMVSFISKAYGGRHSDCFIIRDSGFLLLIEPGDSVLCDKGFPAIKTTMADEGAVLVMPPFNVEGGQLSREDMETTLTIAQVRIHVESAIQRLKLHNVLTNRVPLTLIPQM
ncbi:hypothetical protein HPB51_023329 [Rhipicephalus microplus]|uniref:Tick transposon n=1 Tax=Rhipicephalus microplus TaxID=6941 RepID=A0A9J6EPD7_RHIMP|nr:hypothetical protein HPB51_023329 [Rhipicephalus microplus]